MKFYFSLANRTCQKCLFIPQLSPHNSFYPVTRPLAEKCLSPPQEVFQSQVNIQKGAWNWFFYCLCNWYTCRHYWNLQLIYISKLNKIFLELIKLKPIINESGETIAKKWFGWDNLECFWRKAINDDTRLGFSRLFPHLLSYVNKDFPA